MLHESEQVIVDIYFVPGEVGADVFNYVNDAGQLPEGYVTKESHTRYCMGFKIPKDLAEYMVLRWPDYIDFNVDPELHGDNAWYNRIEENADK